MQENACPLDWDSYENLFPIYNFLNKVYLYYKFMLIKYNYGK